MQPADKTGSAIHPTASTTWRAGVAPVSVVMISLNEAHNMEAVLENLRDWAQEVFLVDSYSSDETVSIALRHGVHVVQHAFRDFGDQWNFALRELPINGRWTMKLDPDERISNELKREIVDKTATKTVDGYFCPIRLFFMDRALPVRQRALRLWQTGKARFSNVAANEHAVVPGPVSELSSDIEHRDSPNLHHWVDKQNKYTTAEAQARIRGDALAIVPSLFGDRLQRRMWIKRQFPRIPFRYTLLFLYHYIFLGAWRAGWVGYAWSRLRCDVYRMVDYKAHEMRITGRKPALPRPRKGAPDPRVEQL